ncbi:MAG: endolytic transglycosylase MltG [Eubacterium sp.]|nr:endolytic transglycosylase MltG [Eubacterium sp.]
MDNNDFNLEETGINPVDTAGNNNDVYFSNVAASKPEKPKAAAAVKKVPPKNKKGQSVAGTYVFFIVVIVLSMILSVYAVMCMNDILAITKTNSTVTVSYTEQINDIDTAIDLLADNGLIKCKNFCKLFAKFRESQIGPQYRNGVYNEEMGYEPGVYYLSGKMGLEGMLQAMHGNTTSAETVHLTFPEGLTVPEIVDKLVANEVCDKAALLSVIETVNFTYSLVSDLQADEKVPYRLEGYMFPDTYDFYVGESASSVVKKFLSNGDARITEEHRKKAQELGYSMEEIIIIASIIQMEAGDDDQMEEVSAILHNRLSDTVNYTSLGCDSTSDYIKNKVGPSLSSTSSHTADYYLSYYNTSNSSKVVGLPEGPICNPGLAAIEAALNPADSDAYFFFHDRDGNIYTAKTNSEFNEKIATYAPYLLA